MPPPQDTRYSGATTAPRHGSLRLPPVRLDGALIAALILTLALAACGKSYVVGSGAADRPNLDRFQTMSEDGVTVTLHIPADDEAASTFGLTLADYGVQPVWLRIQNASDTDYWLLPIAIDPDYYSADEVAFVAGKDVPRASRQALIDQFRSTAIPFYIPAGGTNEGYVYASHVRGGRFVDLRLSGRRKAIRMRFGVLLPTQGFDYEKSALNEIYRKIEELPDLSVEEARVRIRELPCCTTNADGNGSGDPINIALIGFATDIVPALTASGWYFTEAITVESIRKMVGAAVAGERFATAPVSALYVFGRPQDLALQRGRATISQRNHMRLWLAPFRCEGRPVWVGQVSRDIGVKVTDRSPTLTTHVIDPVVDEAREYLLHSLLHRESVQWFSFARGVGSSDAANPRSNLTGDPYITDGMRMVVMLSREPVPPEEAENLGWNESTDPIRESKGEAASVTPRRD